jgi:hypothetical protein
MEVDSGRRWQMVEDGGRWWKTVEIFLELLKSEK